MWSAVDTNVLLDVLVPGAPHGQASKALLDRAISEGALVLCEAVYAELAAWFSSGPELDAFLAATRIAFVASTPAALKRAGDAWRKYASARPRGRLACPECGSVRPVACASCGRAIAVRQHVLADFLIGGHAAALTDRLLTRDRGYYRTYFPGLAILAPG